MPIIKGENGDLTQQISSFYEMDPMAFEVIYSQEGELQKACDEARRQEARCWVNTMWERLSPGHSDDRNLEDPDAHWGKLIELGVDMFQTDRPQELLDYLNSRSLR